MELVEGVSFGKYRQRWGKMQERVWEISNYEVTFARIISQGYTTERKERGALRRVKENAGRSQL
jgi:hypothetical protein